MELLWLLYMLFLHLQESLSDFAFLEKKPARVSSRKCSFELGGAWSFLVALAWGAAAFNWNYDCWVGQSF